MAAKNDTRKRAPKFMWNEQLSTIALREVYFTKPYQFPGGSAESAAAWKSCVEHLSVHPEFVGVTLEKLRDHIRTSLAKRLVVVRELEKASGVDETETEYKKLMDDVTAERDDFVLQHTEKKEKEKKGEAEKEVKGKDCRMMAMESIGETKKRKSESPESPETLESKKKRERRSSSDMIGFLEKRSAERQATMEAELKVREKEIEKRSEDSKAVTGGMLQMMAVMQDQLNYTRQKEEKERQEREEERRLQREQQRQQSDQMTALLGALINKLDKK